MIKKVLLTCFISLLTLLVMESAFAAEPFAGFVDALAAEAGQADNAGGSWTRLDKVKGVVWQWPAAQADKRGYMMAGKMAGDVDVIATGDKGGVQTIRIIAPGAKPAVKAFGRGMASRISTTCDASKSPRVALFQFVKPGRQPLYIGYNAVLAKGSSSGTAYALSKASADPLENMTFDKASPCKVLVK